MTRKPSLTKLEGKAMIESSWSTMSTGIDVTGVGPDVLTPKSLNWTEPKLASGICRPVVPSVGASSIHSAEAWGVL